MKFNYTAIIAAAFAFSALLLPWLTVSSQSTWAVPQIKMEYTVHLYQLSGTVNNVSLTTTPNVWFLWSALALVLYAGVAGIVGSFLRNRRGQILVLSAGLTALLSMVVFGAGVLNSEFVQTELEPAYVMNLFPPNAFGISSEAAMQYGYTYSWFLNYGFWLARAAAILSFVSTVLHPMNREKAN